MGRNYAYSEWLEFECEGVEISDELEKLGEKFGERAIEVANAFLHSQFGLNLPNYNDGTLVWNTYASIVGHGVGLWEEDGDTDLPGEIEGKLDKIVKKDKKLEKLAYQIQNECAGLRSDAGLEEPGHAAKEMQAKDFPGDDEALEHAQKHFGATHYAYPTQGKHMKREFDVAYYVFTPAKTGYFERRVIYKKRGLYHFAKATEFKALPKDAIPMKKGVSYGSEEARAGEREIVRYRFEDEREWHRCSLASFRRHNEGLLDDEDLAVLRSGGRVWYGGGAQPLGFVELIAPASMPGNPRGGEPLREEMVRPELEAWEGTKTADAEALFWRIKRQGGRVFAKQQANGRWRVWVRLHDDQGEAMGEAATRDAALFDAWKKYKRGGDLEETPQGGEPLQASESFERFSSWLEVLTYAKTHEYLLYQAPMDVRPHRVRVEKVFSNGKIRLDPMSSDADSFTADRTHFDRMLKPTAPRGGGPLPGGSEGAPAQVSGGEKVPVEDAVPWVKITRDPELYAAGIKRAKEIGPIDDGKKVYELLAPALAKEDQEVFLAVFLNVRQQCIGVTEIHRGERSRVAVSRADVLRGVVKTGADHFIIVHNHPSGDPTPSDADKKLTKAMMDGAKKVDIPCIDHVVIGMGKYYSFAKGKVIEVRT